MHKKIGSAVRYSHTTEAGERAWSAECHPNTKKGTSQPGYYLANPRSHPQIPEAAGFLQKPPMATTLLCRPTVFQNGKLKMILREKHLISTG